MKLISLPLSMAERRCFLDSFEKQDVNRAKYSGLCLSFRNPRKKTNMGKGNIASNRIVSSGAGKKKNRAENRDATEEKVFLHYPREPNSFAPIWDPFNVTFPPHIQYDGVSLFDERGRRKGKGDRKKGRLAATLLLLSFPIQYKKRFFVRKKLWGRERIWKWRGEKLERRRREKTFDFPFPPDSDESLRWENRKEKEEEEESLPSPPFSLYISSFHFPHLIVGIKTFFGVTQRKGGKRGVSLFRGRMYQIEGGGGTDCTVRTQGVGELQGKRRFCDFSKKGWWSSVEKKPCGGLPYPISARVRYAPIHTHTRRRPDFLRISGGCGVGWSVGCWPLLPIPLSTEAEAGLTVDFAGNESTVWGEEIGFQIFFAILLLVVLWQNFDEWAILQKKLARASVRIFTMRGSHTHIQAQQKRWEILLLFRLSSSRLSGRGGVLFLFFVWKEAKKPLWKKIKKVGEMGRRSLR